MTSVRVMKQASYVYWNGKFATSTSSSGDILGFPSAFIGVPIITGFLFMLRIKHQKSDAWVLKGISVDADYEHRLIHSIAQS